MTANKPEENDLEMRLECFGQQWRERSSLSDNVVQILREESFQSTSQPTSLFGGLTMTQRITYGSICAAALGLLMFFFITSSATATFAQVVENIARAKSYSVTLNMVMVSEEAAEVPPFIQTIHARLPNAFHTETLRVDRVDDRSTQIHNVSMTFRDRPGIEIDHVAKTYRAAPSALGSIPPLAMLEKLGQCLGETKKDLGTKLFGETKCNGFEIDLNEVDPDAGEGKLTVWVNADTQLPHQVEILASKPMPILMEMSGFVWNTPLEDALFDATPPEGYVDVTEPEEPIENQVQQIVDSLKLYANLAGGHYPKVSQIYGDSTREELRTLAGFKGKFDPDWQQDPKFQEIIQATEGFAHITLLQRNNPDAKYFGKTVGPTDADKVLLFWKLANGKYQVIYGDLKSESVAFEEIKLE